MIGVGFMRLIQTDRRIIYSVFTEPYDMSFFHQKWKFENWYGET